MGTGSTAIRERSGTSREAEPARGRRAEPVRCTDRRGPVTVSDGSNQGDGRSGGTRFIRPALGLHRRVPDRPGRGGRERSVSAWRGPKAIAQQTGEAQAKSTAATFLIALTNFDAKSIDADFSKITSMATGRLLEPGRQVLRLEHPTEARGGPGHVARSDPRHLRRVLRRRAGFGVFGYRPGLRQQHEQDAPVGRFAGRGEPDPASIRLEGLQRHRARGRLTHLTLLQVVPGSPTGLLVPGDGAVLTKPEPWGSFSTPNGWTFSVRRDPMCGPWPPCRIPSSC